MKLIKPSFKIIEQESGLEGIYKQIERVGRTCYKSEDKISEGTAKSFVDRMITSNHLAMCEHGTIYLKYPIGGIISSIENTHDYLNNPYSKVKEVWEYEKTDDILGLQYAYVTTNLRVLIEHNWLEDLQYICEPTENHYRRISVLFTLDQGVMREFTRHRAFSFACESTRYCNYFRAKFGNEITFIEPDWLCDTREINSEAYDSAYEIFCSAMEEAEAYYMMLIENGFKPQQARNVLPLATKCDLVMTGFVDDWDHFFDLRSRGTTGAPHPQAKELAEPLLTEFIKRNYLIL